MRGRWCVLSVQSAGTGSGLSSKNKHTVVRIEIGSGRIGRTASTGSLSHPITYHLHGSFCVTSKANVLSPLTRFKTPVKIAKEGKTKTNFLCFSYLFLIVSFLSYRVPRARSLQSTSIKWHSRDNEFANLNAASTHTFTSR